MDEESILKELNSWIELLDRTQKEYVQASKNYSEVKNSIWLNTDWEDALGKTKPTVDEKKAYVSANSLIQRTDKDTAYYNILLIKEKIKLCYAELELLKDV